MLDSSSILKFTQREKSLKRFKPNPNTAWPLRDWWLHLNKLQILFQNPPTKLRVSIWLTENRSESDTGCIFDRLVFWRISMFSCNFWVPHSRIIILLTGKCLFTSLLLAPDWKWRRKIEFSTYWILFYCSLKCGVF